MKHVEATIYDSFVKFKMKFARPLLFLMDKLKIHPHFLTFLSIPAGFLSFYAFTPGHQIWIVYAIIIHMLADGLDGPLARYQNRANDKGKFLDVLAGNLFIAILVIALAYSGLLEGYLATTFIYLMVLLEVLGVIYNNISNYKSRDWLFFARSGFFCHLPKTVLMLYLIIWSFVEIDFMSELAIALTTYMVITSLIFFIRVMRA